MIDTKDEHKRLPTVGYYGLNQTGYEVIELKESHVLRMFDAGEITAQPVCLMEDALDAIAATGQPVPPTTHNFEMTEDHIELLVTMLHFVPHDLMVDLNAFCHDARTALNKPAIAQPKETK